MPRLIDVPFTDCLSFFGGLQQYFLGRPEPHCCIDLLHLRQFRMCKRLFTSFDPFGLLMLPRLRLGLARRKRLAVGHVLFVLLSGSCCLGMFSVCLLLVCVKPNAVMLTHGMHSLRTLALSSRLCLRLASTLCLNHFVMHVSGRVDLARCRVSSICLAKGLGLCNLCRF